MDDNEREFAKAAFRENCVLYISTALCVGLIALGTHSLHCLWGLLMMLFVNSVKESKEKNGP